MSERTINIKMIRTAICDCAGAWNC